MPSKPIPVKSKRPTVKAPAALGPKAPSAKKPVVKSSKPRVASKGLQTRTADRLGRLVSRGGKAPAGVKAGRPVTLSQAQAIKAALLALNAKHRVDVKTKTAADAAKPAPFNPLEPLTGKAFEDELGAASRSQFADSDQAIGNAYTSNQQASELTGSYYDQYKQALAAAAGRVKQYNDEQVSQSQGRVDQSYSEDSTAAKARADAASRQAGQLGLSGTQGDEGARATEAARTQGNARVGEERSVASASNEFMENRQATALKSKAEALGRLQAGRAKIDSEATKVAGQKGDFATNYRAKTRESERDWAAVQEEFGLKKAAADQTSADNVAKNKIEAQKLATQKLVAKMYSDADATKAAATIRVAKLQLEKGKIDQKQYREIVNIYKGLPKKGKPTPAKTTDTTADVGGSGAGGKLAPWEQDAQDKAIRGFTTNKYDSGDYARAIQKAVKAGIPKRLAEMAWKQYIGHVKTPYDSRTRG